MPGLIIGHTTATSARIWVRGDHKSTTCKVVLRRATTQESPHSRELRLEPGSDYTAVVDFDDLRRGVEYIAQVTFSPSRVRVRGRVCTIRDTRSALPESFAFVLSSCNLSIVSVNDFLALMVATAGSSLGLSSLDLPLQRWKAPRLQWLRRLFRPTLKWALMLAAGGIRWTTALKQPGPQYLRSPFLKLSAVFESCVLEVELPVVGTKVPPDERERFFLAVSERVQSSWGATGVVASLALLEDERSKEGERSVVSGAACDNQRKTRRYQIVLAQVDGQFEAGAVLFRQVRSNRNLSLRRLGTIMHAAPGRQWYDQPSFFIHAGDQIYYDFPDPDRPPNRDLYRTAYREAWFEDDALRHLLAHWPHYMTLDDHEIADQFARDFHSPDRDFTADDYLLEASVAYREYADALSSPDATRQLRPECGPFWYTFAKDSTQFFVLDTRTRRENTKGQIIDEPQMAALLHWMCKHRRELKFVVTSVPFVAEINEETSNTRPDWYKQETPPPAARVATDTVPSEAKRNSEHDKWSAAWFTRQREQIIDFIATNCIEYLVFLTGDMHCCYHATMSIRGDKDGKDKDSKDKDGKDSKDKDSKYRSITVHELAGGPVNQLQLATAAQFKRHCIKHTGAGHKYEMTLERFHGEVSAVMHVKVEYRQREHVTDWGRALMPEVEWNVIRMLTDPGPAAWLDDATPPRSSSEQQRSRGESVMGGRISFVRRRDPEDLPTWDGKKP